jgi:hypothetical protein
MPFYGIVKSLNQTNHAEKAYFFMFMIIPWVKKAINLPFKNTRAPPTSE